MIPFLPASCLVQAPYLVKFTSPVILKSVCICIYNTIRYSLTKRISFCSSFKTLSTDTKIGVCQQKLSTLELNFHYRFSSHAINETLAELRTVLENVLPSVTRFHLASHIGVRNPVNKVGIQTNSFRFCN